MSSDDSLSIFFIVVTFVALVGGGAAVLVYGLKLGRRASSRSRKRRYAASPEVVAAAARAAIEQLGYAVYNSDERSISFSLAHMGEGPSTQPVVHVVMLPTKQGETEVEAIGSRSPVHYSWHVMAQAVLTELDKRCPQGAS